MILLDTCTLLWLAAAQDKLSPTARAAVAAARGDLYVSAITAFELSIKQVNGRLLLPRSAGQWYADALAQLGIREIPIDGGIAALSAALPTHHADPCDRIIVATAARNGLVIATPDAQIAQYQEARTVW